MNNIDYEEVAEFLNEHLIENCDHNPSLYEASDNYLVRDGKSAIGRSYAELLLDEFGMIVIKTVYMSRNDNTRIWLANVEVTEEVVTETVQKVEMCD